jgi:hypothetical protein
MRARYYEPGTGRFIQQDSYLGDIKIPLSRNLYAYAQNNPLKYVDPSGNNAKDIIHGIAEALIDNGSAGLVKWIAKKLGGEKKYNYANEYDYYLGQVIGDALSLLPGIASIITGINTIIGSITGGAAVSVLSNGTLILGGITIVGSGVALGTVEVGYGTAIVVAASSNFSNAFPLCDSDFAVSMSENFLPLKVTEEDRRGNLTVFIIKEIYYREFVKLVKFLIENAPNKKILFQTRYQGGDKELIIGVIKWSEFLTMLDQKQIFFNICYIIEDD